MILTGKLQQWGNSYGIRVSKKTATKLGLRKNDALVIEVQEAPPKSGFGIFPTIPSFKRDKSDDIREWRT